MAWKENAKTKHVVMNLLKAGVAITGAALLFACGDDDSSFVASENGGSAAEADIVVATFDYLPNCTDNREGKTAYIKEENATYVCTDGDWVVAGETGDEGDDDGDNADKKSSSSTSKDEFLNPKISYGEMTDSRDKHVYKTVEICNNKTSACQTWMAENLNYSVNPNVQSWCGGGSGATEGDCSVYGRLYTWAAAVGKSEDECGYEKTCNLPSGDIRGVCPEGWLLPSFDEWRALFSAVGGFSKAGTALKSQTGWYSQTGDAADRDAYGFSALPAGIRYDDGGFYGADLDAYFWSASEVSSDDAYLMDLYYGYEDADLDYYNKSYGISVRCLQN